MCRADIDAIRELLEAIKKRNDRDPGTSISLRALDPNACSMLARQAVEFQDDAAIVLTLLLMVTSMQMLTLKEESEALAEGFDALQTVEPHDMISVRVPPLLIRLVRGCGGGAGQPDSRVKQSRFLVYTNWAGILLCGA